MPKGSYLTDTRPKVPIEIQRAVLTEAGHRCAIPTCRAVPVDLAHIEPWAKVKVHTFENIIALCPTCHRRFDKGDIDRPSMRVYKANLAMLNSRYCSFERRILELFALNLDHQVVQVPSGSDIQIFYLLKDGILESDFPGTGAGTGTAAEMKTALMLMGPVQYRLTPEGKDLVVRLANSRSLS